MTIPTGPETLTPRWLSAVLGRAIASVDITRIGEDEGFTGGGLFRLALDDGKSLIAKLSPVDPDMRRTFAPANAREVQFYDQLASGLPVPGCAYGTFDKATGASILLLQDLTKFRARAFVDGLSVDDARSVVGSMAQIHAKWWNASELADLSGSDFLNEVSFSSIWERYLDKVTTLLPDASVPQALIDLGDYVAENQFEVYGDLLDRGAMTVLHRDCQADNVMFSGDGSAILLDWQFFGRGRGPYDVAYALISSMLPQDRRASEVGLLEGYCDSLARLGITDYGFDACWADYRRSVVAKLNVTVFATVLLDNSSAPKRAWRRADLERLSAFVTDHAIGPADFEVSG